MRTSAWRMIAYALIVLLGTLTALPNFMTAADLRQLPNWLPHRQMAMGLDLRGGAHVVLALDTEALVAERMQDLLRQTREALAQARIDLSNIRIQSGDIVATLRSPSQSAEARGVVRKLANAATDLDIRLTAPSELRVRHAPDGVAGLVQAAAEQSLEIIRVRIDGTGLVESSLQRIGADRISVQVPGLTDTERLKKILNSTAKLSFHMTRPADPSGRVPPGVTLRKLKDSARTIPVEDRVMLSGERLADAKLDFDPTTNLPVISFRFDATGASRFAAITRENVGKPFAIVLDGEVLTAPVIETPIVGGMGQIRGDFTAQSASDLAALIRAGALPAPMKVVQEHTVGPDAGRDAIERGITTGLIGFVLVFAFMALLYGRWGLVANAALLLNVILTIAALTILGATLTLPGIAGIVLGIGLAVDANVLINERIREETRKGASAPAALDAGFKRAFATIVDSNLTALIATTLLFMFGTGPVRGFAVTMGLGIAISMFTAVTVVRVIMSEVVRRWRLKALSIEPLLPTKLIPDGTAIPFMSARKFGLAVSAALSIASVALFASPGLNYGVDFKGGIQLDVTAPAPIDLPKLRTGLESLKLGDIALQSAGNASHILVSVEQQAEGSDAIDGLRAKIAAIAPGAKIQGDAVGPRVSGELATTGILAVILASLAMMIYIWARFEWPFAVGAIATLVLDVTKTIGFFALTGLEFNLTAIAALLTLIGYSVNDKVVVYDRMRENMRLLKNTPLREIIDRSINETLGRSLYTSVTALVAVLPMAIWGGSAVASFAVPMVFGILVAASSSVFIAAPILLYLGDWRKNRSNSGKDPKAQDLERYCPPRGGRTFEPVGREGSGGGNGARR